ncbi:MAG: methyl-accepting chemotaxis protein, partial [Clostridia bacterium]|nr:methyl-accepting chemotaxis protein [Clostridia bacterium]
MIKKMRLGHKLSFYTGIVVLIGFAVLITIVLSQIFISSQEQAMAIAKLNAQYYGSQVEQKFNKIKIVAQSLANETEAMRKEDKVSREVVMTSIKAALNVHEDIFGITIAYEAGELDSHDKQYSGEEGHGKDGRFMPYITRDGQDFFVDIGVYEEYTEEQMKWYNVPKNTKNIYLTDPITYPVQGKDVTMASIVLPILRGEKFVGVVSIDMELNDLQEEIERVKPMGGFAELLSASGIYVATGQGAVDKVNTNAAKEEEWVPLLQKTSRGYQFSATGRLAETGEEVLRVFSPVHLEGSEEYWTYVSIIPVKSILAEYYALLKLMIGVSIGMLACIMVFKYYIINRAIKPVAVVSKILTNMAESDFTDEVPQKLFRNHDEVGDLARAIDAMKNSTKEIINGVIGGAKILEEFTIRIKDNISELDVEIEEVSATTQELSAGMEQTAA